MAEVTQPTTPAAPTAQASTPTPTPTPTSAAPASPTVVLAQAQSAPAARPPAPRTDAQLVAIFDRWYTEEQAGRMTRAQVLAEARALPPEELQRMRPAVAARDAAAAQRSAEAVAAAEEAGRRSAEEVRRAQEELRRAREAAARALGSGATPSPSSSPSNGSSPNGGSAPSSGTSPSRGGAPRSSIISDKQVSYNGGIPGIDTIIAGLATSAKYNPTNLPVNSAAVFNRLPQQALHMA